MRSLIALLALALTAALAPAADLGPAITTTDGCSYVRAADGCYYPANSVPAAKSVVAGCSCGPNCQVSAAKAPLYSGCPCLPHVPGTPWPDPANCGAYGCQANGGGHNGLCPCNAPPQFAAPGSATCATTPRAIAAGPVVRVIRFERRMIGRLFRCR